MSAVPDDLEGGTSIHLEGADVAEATGDRRVPGRRGGATRRRLLDCTAALLAKTSYRDIKIIDIAREAGTSPATFYQYFADVEHAVLVLAEELAPGGDAVAALVKGDWRGERGAERAREVVASFIEYYEQHRAVFRVVDLATEEGDLRFQKLRTRALHGITEAMRDAIADSQRDAKIGPEVVPDATAFVLIAMLAHSAAHRYGFEFWGVRTADSIESMARLLYWSITGRKMPARRD